MTTATSAPTVSCDAALAVARADAERAYGDLSYFRIEIQLEEDGWRIAFRLKQILVAGGGPHYVISADTGEILDKKYYQ